MIDFLCVSIKSGGAGLNNRTCGQAFADREVEVGPNRARQVPSGTNLLLFKISFSIFSLSNKV